MPWLPADWGTKLPLVEFAFNSHINQSTGITPFFADLGRHPRGPIDAITLRSSTPSTALQLRDELRAISAQLLDAGLVARTRQARYADLHRRPHELRIGDQVFVRSTHLLSPAARALPHPLRPRWAGPFPIIGSVSGTSFRLRLPRFRRAHPIFHASNLRLAVPDSWPEHRAPPPPDNDGEFEVEAILDHSHYPRLRNASGTLIGPKPRFLVSWLGYPPEEASWEPLSHLYFDGHICQPLLTYLSRHSLPLPT